MVVGTGNPDLSIVLVPHGDGAPSMTSWVEDDDDEDDEELDDDYLMPRSTGDSGCSSSDRLCLRLSYFPSAALLCTV